MATPSPPSKLLALPPEIRNDIWDLAFSGFILRRAVNPVNANPPNKALLLSNRQISNEAKSFFSSRYMQYWESSIFCFAYNHLNKNPPVNFQDQALASIRLIALCIDSVYLYGGHWAAHRFHITRGTKRLLNTRDELVPDYIKFRRRGDGSWWSESVHRLEDDELQMFGRNDLLVVTVGDDGLIHCCCPAELSSKMATPPSPSRLLALPPEIRNSIWELSFSGTNHTVDLLTCHPPSLDLLLASRQVYEEAKGFWPGRRREFFSSTSFSVTRGKKVNVKAISFTDNDVKHIKDISLYVRGCNIRHLGRMTKQLQEVLGTTSILDSDEVWTFKRRDRTL
ncbi:hypothetical protein LTR10_010905 [Elasticomyces elasticus]|nr:hypothetical protein LTR10_010905 [Elasticomyces elasticus]KAK4968510.1 hypothetical protein LTR42_009793 [Elasticomyces elasticus]